MSALRQPDDTARDREGVHRDVQEDPVRPGEAARAARGEVRAGVGVAEKAGSIHAVPSARKALEACDPLGIAAALCARLHD